MTPSRATSSSPSITMMVRNFPRRSGRARLLENLHATGFDGTYDFLYLPFCFAKKQNLGYAFINFCTPEFANRFQQQWHNKCLGDERAPADPSKSRPLHVSIALIQGKENNVRHLLRECKSSKIVNSKFQPVVYQNGVRVDFVEYVLYELNLFSTSDSGAEGEGGGRA